MAYGGDRVSSVAQKESMVVELGKVGDCSMLTHCRRPRWKFVVSRFADVPFQPVSSPRHRP